MTIIRDYRGTWHIFRGDSSYAGAPTSACGEKVSMCWDFMLADANEDAIEYSTCAHCRHVVGVQQ